MSKRTIFIVIVVALALVAVIFGVSYFSSQQNKKLNSQTATTLTQGMTDAQVEQFNSYSNSEFDDQVKPPSQSIFK